MYYSQKDDRWKDKKVGYGKLTFAQAGCFLTSVANKLKYDGISMTPLEVNELAKNCGAFNVDLLNLSILSKALGYNYIKQTSKPTGRHIFETNYYKNSGVPQHFCFMREDGKRIDPLDKEPSWEENNYPIVSYRVLNKIKEVDLPEKEVKTEVKQEPMKDVIEEEKPVKTQNLKPSEVLNERKDIREAENPTPELIPFLIELINNLIKWIKNKL